MGNIRRRKLITVMSTLKQRKDKKLKDYLACFSQEVSEVQDPNDDAVMAAFVNSLHHNQLSLSLRQRGPITYANLVNDVGGYALAEEEQIAHEGEYIHGGRPNAEAINTIFGGPYNGRSSRERMLEFREAIDGQRNMEVNLVGPDHKKLKQGWDRITFSEADACGLEVKPNDAIIVTVRIEHHEVRRILIDNGSSADILSAGVFDQLGLHRKDLQPQAVPLRGFGGAEVRSLGTIKLLVEVGNFPC
ncbi:hypothetical protein Dsin_001571 [Dipteronia sinensis]|uniref:Peptidase A2 domain-containing protein n=1 Tax=Dipteronia sinensis TaxID=43782 RepID=A0AAE0EKE6_9ROSI|nr:hypothetical protein Dsin_001571 [Dipteronia sinensis]